MSDDIKSPIADLFIATCHANERLMDRIEKLEVALKHCINALRQYEMGDDRPRGPAGDVRPWLLGAMDNAIKVLEGKDD
jgi:hypothetical protein